jgi:carboxymethylenebutenolidase
MTASISVTASDGSGAFDALVVSPRHAPAGAVVLIQEMFGLNDAMRATCHHVAELGFIAVCPDLFWRQERGVSLSDKSKEDWARAFALMNGLDQTKAIDDLKATVAAARILPGANGRVATMGYCLGGRMALLMAEHSDADANISYYGVGLDGLLGELDRVGNPLVVHIADQDEFVAADARARVVAATMGRPHIATYVYPNANHAFARVGGVHWDARSATIANGRSTEALVAALG